MNQKNYHPSYLSQKLELRPCAGKGGYGIYACESVSKDEVLAVWGGVVVPGERLQEFSHYAQTHGLQVEDDLFLLPLSKDDPSDYFNHSCNPNAGLLGQITLVAMRAISPGEEVCFDYAMSDSNPYDEFECCCGSPLCRGHVTAHDWSRKDLQERYRGYFSSYLQRRIEAQKRAG
jgi:hypothetical protein